MIILHNWKMSAKISKSSSTDTIPHLIKEISLLIYSLLFWVGSCSGQPRISHLVRLWHKEGALMNPEDGVCFASFVVLFFCAHFSSLLCSKVWPVKQVLTITLDFQESNLSLRGTLLLPLVLFLFLTAH